MNSPCSLFLPESALQLIFFIKPGIIRQLTADNLHQQQFFTIQQLLLIFLKLFKSFKQNR